MRTRVGRGNLHGPKRCLLDLLSAVRLSLLYVSCLWLFSGGGRTVRLGFPVDALGKFVISLAFLDLFSLAFGERRRAFTFGDSWAPNSRDVSGQRIRCE